MSNIETALSALDDQITKASGGGEKGSGIYGLLSTLATQFLGVPRAPFIAPKGDDHAQGDPDPDGGNA